MKRSKNGHVLSWWRLGVGGLLLATACGSGGAGDTVKRDAASSRPDAAVSQNGEDAGCDEDALGESYCIVNSPGGNGSAINRLNPVAYEACKSQ